MFDFVSNQSGGHWAAYFHCFGVYYQAVLAIALLP